MNKEKVSIGKIILTILAVIAFAIMTVFVIKTSYEHEVLTGIVVGKDKDTDTKTDTKTNKTKTIKKYYVIVEGTARDGVERRNRKKVSRSTYDSYDIGDVYP